MEATVLVLNSGSSSVKYSLVQPDSGCSIADGIVERIGEDQSVATLVYGDRTLRRERAVADHEAALLLSFDLFAEAGGHPRELGLIGVGHRVVHGGGMFYRPTVIDDTLVTRLEELAPLAPLHNPPGILGIEVARKMLPELPHVAVFDTAFFHDLPAVASTYAIDRDVARTWGIRRYGFHGTSHRYVSARTAEFLGVSSAEINQIVLHLGNGASASAIAGGRPVDTSMGFTPMEGLVMGTRSGDVDPGIIFFLARRANMAVADVEAMLNRRSGVFGLGGANDFRELRRRIDAGDVHAQLAYEVYVHRLRKYIGGYLAVLGQTDVITFTAGVGENAVPVRRDALAGLEPLGIVLDEQRNGDPSRAARVISAPDSPTTVLVVPTNEELAIARDTVAAIAAASG